MKKKTKLCIYCGEREATERDHVPPKCFFPEPLPSDLITVPSCSNCNREYGKTDEFVRDILISLDTTEKKLELSSVRAKMHRSFIRKQSTNLLLNIYSAIRQVKIVSKDQILLGRSKAFDLDRKEFDRFFERLGRALLYKEFGCKHFAGRFEWNDLVDYSQFPFPIKYRLENDIRKSFANGQFKYFNVSWSGSLTSLWFIRLYDSIDFRIYVENV